MSFEEISQQWLTFDNVACNLTNLGWNLQPSISETSAQCSTNQTADRLNNQKMILTSLYDFTNIHGPQSCRNLNTVGAKLPTVSSVFVLFDCEIAT